MAKHGIGFVEMGKVIGNTAATFSRKINKVSEFTFNDMILIRDFFASKDEQVTIDGVFFAWEFHKSENK